MILNGNALAILKTLGSGSIDCCITSPPYYRLRDYGVDGQLGLEETPEEYIENLVKVFEEVKRVLKKEGTLWIVIGDSYAQKKLIGIPWLLAFALRNTGWYLRQDIIWAKNNPMPESVNDRCTRSHEYIFLFSKSKKYYYDADAIKEPAVWQPGSREDKKQGEFGGKYDHAHSKFKHISKTFRAIRPFRNKRDVWQVSTNTSKIAHYATFPLKLIEPCILAGCPIGGVVLDPFCGTATTGVGAIKNDRNFIGIEISSESVKLSEERLKKYQEEKV